MVFLSNKNSLKSMCKSHDLLTLTLLTSLTSKGAKCNNAVSKIRIGVKERDIKYNYLKLKGSMQLTL